MKNKRIISAVLLCALICAAFAACGDSSKPIETASASTADIVSDETTSAETGEFDNRKYVDDGIGEYDFGGEEFNIVLSTEQMEEPYYVEGETGDTIDDAVYARTVAVEERFNVKLVHHDTGGNWNEVAEAVKKSVLAGDGAYDLAAAHTFIGLTGLVGSGYLCDWNTLPGVDMSRPWWNSSVRDELAIDDRLYVASSDYIYQRPIVIYFNKEMISDFSLENPYELVKNGSWTWDKLKDMACSVSADLDGDGEYTENDRYGYLHTLGWQTISVIHSQGMFMTERDSDGYVNFNSYNTDKMAAIFQNYYDLVWNGNQTYYLVYDPAQGAKNGYTPMFGAGQVLFLHSNTELLSDFRDVTLDFGMLPLPKYDEAQDGYYSMADTQMLCVPSGVANPEMCGVIAEALAVESYRTVVPAVYEVTFANKYLRDEESYDMFTIMREGLVYEFSWTFGEGNNMIYALPNMMQKKSVDLTSYYAKNAPGAEKTIAKFIDNVLALE